MSNIKVSDEKIMSFYTKYILTNKIPPSFEYACKHLGLKSKSSMHFRLQKLSRLGYMSKLPNGKYYPDCLKVERKNWSGTYKCIEYDIDYDSDERALDFTINKEYKVHKGKLKSDYGYNTITGITGERIIKSYGFVFTRIGNKYIKED